HSTVATKSWALESTPSAARFQSDRCPAERSPVTVATSRDCSNGPLRKRTRFQAIVGTAAHLLGSNIAHYGFEQGANDRALAKALEFAAKPVDKVNETVLDRRRQRE